MENKIKKNIISLAPSYNIDNLEEYDDILTKCLNEKRQDNKSKNIEYLERKNRNIAITGEFGCGKSSLLNSYFAKHEEYKCINISMGILDNNENIYSYILKQLLYYVRPYRLPFSKYKRRDKSYRTYYIMNILFAVSIVLLILMISKMIVINNTFWKNVYISVPIFIIVMNLLHNVNIKKLAFDKADVELESILE